MNKSRSLLLLSVLAVLFAACEEGIFDNAVLSQDYTEPEYSIAVSPSELSFPAEGGEEKVLLALTQSLSWTATTNAPWITLSDNSGTDSPSPAIHVVVAENTSVESRTGTVTFKTREKTATLTVTQDATQPVLAANANVLTFPFDGGTQEISITSNARWTVVNPSSWLSLFADSGTGDATLTVTAAENSTTFFRQSTLTLNYGGEPVSIAFLQHATPDLNGHAYVDLGLPSGLLWATCNVGATTPEDYGDYFAWGETAKKNSYTWANYKWSEGGMQSLTKYNSRNDYGIVDNLSELLLSDDAVVVNWGGCWRMPTYAEWEELCNTDNCTWTPLHNNGHCEGYKVTSTRNGNSIFLPSAGLYTESGLDGADMNGYFWASTLFSVPDQGCGLYFDDAGHPHAFSRYQGLSVRPVGKMTLHFSLTPTAIDFPAASSSETLSVTANQPWTATTSDAWLTLSNTSGEGDASLTISAEENTSITSRTGTVTFQTGATTYAVSVTQKGATPIFEATPSSLSYSASGGSETISITSNQSWTATTSDAWFNISAAAGEGNATLTVTAEENSSIAERSGKVTFSAGGNTYTVNITQKGADLIFSVTPTTFSFTSSGGNQSVSVKSNQAWTVSFDVSWLSLSTVSGTGDATLTITAQTNTSTDNRAGTVTFTSGGKTYTVTIIQDGVATHFEISPSTLSFTSSGGSKSVSVMSNQPWTVSSDASWLKLSDNSGTSDATLTITAQANKSAGNRAGAITFITGSASYTVNVTQAGVEASKAYLTFEAIENTSFSFSENDLHYSLDGGTTWTTLPAETESPILQAGDRISWKASDLTPSNNEGIGTFRSTGKFNVEGNIMSLLFEDDFVGKTSLSDYKNAFRKLFYECTKIVNANNLILPATILAEYCYYCMFDGCTHLTNEPELPATTLVGYCYYGMFSRCTSLTTAPELPATTLSIQCYNEMFQGCTNLTTTPELPAKKLAEHCYDGMFNGCKSLTTAPALPATTLAPYCYASMFLSCSSLTTAPSLPATTLTEGCYWSMFAGCTSLTTAPELPATTLATCCYYQMFNNCPKLNYIKCLATDISASGCTENWVLDVATSGTFVKDASMTSWTTGTSGIPSGWTVQEDGFSITPTAFSFAASGGSQSITLKSNQSWTASSSVSWLTLSKTSDTGNATLTLTAQANTSTDNRSGIVTFTAGGKTYTVNVSQDGVATYFEITPTTLSFTSSGGSKSVSVMSNLPWTVSADASWLKLSNNSGTSDATLSVTAEENTSTSSRSGTVTFNAGGKDNTVSVTQEGATPFFNVTPENIAFTSTADSKQISITSNISWTATSNASWLTLSKNAGEGDATLSLSIEENTATDSRTGNISFSARGGTYQITVTQEAAEQHYEEINGHPYVDLGLPSGLLWATMNVGASSPEDYGDYYAWGETRTKSLYSTDNYMWSDNNGSLTKYNNNKDYGFVDNLVELESIDDAATVNWGGGWRIPTYEGWNELLSNCKWTWGKKNGVSGYKATSLLNGNSIFLPAAGYNNSSQPLFAGSKGYYWESTNIKMGGNPVYAYDMELSSDKVSWNFNYRSIGQSIRPVYQPNSYFSLSKENLSYSSNGGDEIIMTLSNQSWTASTSESWIQLSITSGNGNVAVTIAVSKNNSHFRTGSITFTVGEEIHSLAITQEGTPSIHEFVDLGLPSGTLWATSNIGANSPEEYGDYFAWGETTPKSDYTWDTYKWLNTVKTTTTDSDGFETTTITRTFTKYHSEQGSSWYKGVNDRKTDLDAEDDAAAVNWGGGWRMPDWGDRYELIDPANCIWTWTTQGGHNGYKVTSKKNGNFIFFPAAGYRSDTHVYKDEESFYYWGSGMFDFEPHTASILVDYLDEGPYGSFDRYCGCPVRPVYHP